MKKLFEKGFLQDVRQNLQEILFKLEQINNDYRFVVIEVQQIHIIIHVKVIKSIKDKSLGLER